MILWLRPIIYVLVVTGTTGFAFYEYKKSQTEEQQKHKQSLIFSSLKPSQVQSVHIIKSTDKTNVHFLRQNKEWKLNSPIKDIANASVIQDWLKSILSETVKTIKTEGVDWSEYDLNKNITSITLIAKNNKKFVLDISDYSAFNGSIYIRNKNKLLLGGTAFAQLANKPKNYFQSRKLLNIGEHPKTLYYKSKLFKAHLKWENHTWQWNKKIIFPISQAALHTYRTQINNMDFDRKTYLKTKQNLKKFKLLNPDIELNLEFTKNNWFIKISSQIKQKFYAVISTRPYIVTLSKAQKDKILLTIKKIRDHQQPFLFPTNKAYFIELKGYGIEASFKKQKEQWTTLTPKNKEFNTNKISNILNNITLLSANKYVGNKSFKKTAFVILKDKNNKNILKLEFSDSIKQNAQQVYVQSSMGQEVMTLNLKSLKSVFSSSLLKNNTQNNNE